MGGTANDLCGMLTTGSTGNAPRIPASRPLVSRISPETEATAPGRSASTHAGISPGASNVEGAPTSATGADMAGGAVMPGAAAGTGRSGLVSGCPAERPCNQSGSSPATTAAGASDTSTVGLSATGANSSDALISTDSILKSESQVGRCSGSTGATATGATGGGTSRAPRSSRSQSGISLSCVGTA